MKSTFCLIHSDVVLCNVSQFHYKAVMLYKGVLVQSKITNENSCRDRHGQKKRQVGEKEQESRGRG